MSNPPAPRDSGRDVFISYSRKNSEFALKLADALTARGRDPWIDQDDIPPSAEWWDEIKRGIDGAHTFLPILTPESLASAVCTFEMDYALKNHKRIIPVMRSEALKADAFGSIAAIDPTGFLAEILGEANLMDIARDNWRTIEKLNWVMFREQDAFEPALDTLVSALDTDLGRVRLHTRLLTRAHEWEVRGRDPGYLLVEGELREAASWLTVYGDKEPKATDEQRAFVQASLDNEAEEEAARQQQIAELNAATEQARTQRSRARTASIAAGVIGLLALAAGSFGIVQTNAARQQQRLAGTAVQNAAAADTRVGNANVQLTAVPPVLTAAQGQVVKAEDRISTAETAVGLANRQLATATMALVTATGIARQAATGESALQGVNTQVAQAVATVTEVAAVKEIMIGFANALLQNQSAAAQLAAMDALVAEYPDQAEAYISRAMVVGESDPERALADYNEAIQLAPELANAYSNRGSLYFELGQYQKAIDDFDEAIRLAPWMHEAFTNRGAAYMSLQNYDNAIADFDEAIRLNPNYIPAYSNRGAAYIVLGEYDQGFADLGEALRRDPELVEALVSRGNGYNTVGDYEHAMEDLNEAIRLDPEEPVAFYNRGNTYSSLGQYQRAITDFDAALQLDPQYPPAYLGRGIAYTALGDYQSALADFEEAIQLDPTTAEPYYGRGNAYTVLGDYERAIASYDEAIRLNPENEQAFNNRGNAYSLIQDFDHAIADYDEAIRLNPDYTIPYLSRGSAYAYLGFPLLALNDFSEAIRLSPLDPRGYVKRANTFSDLHQYERALADYTSALVFNPQDAETYFNRGSLYLYLGGTAKSSERQIKYLAQGVSDLRQAEAMGIDLPDGTADLIKQAVTIIAASEATPDP